jgi:hypothetical protein
MVQKNGQACETSQKGSAPWRRFSASMVQPHFGEIARRSMQKENENQSKMDHDMMYWLG